MNIVQNTSPTNTPSHTLSQPGSVSHPPYTLTGVNMNRMASQHSSGSSSNYLLMKNVDKIPNASSGSQSFHTISPSLHQSNTHYVSQSTHLSHLPLSTSPQLQLTSNTIKQNIQLPLTYSPVRQDKYSFYKHNDPINQQQEHNYKFELMQLKTAYQQLKQSHQLLTKDYQSIRQRIIVIRNNQQLLAIRNDQLIRNNNILQTRNYQLEEELKITRINQQSSFNQFSNLNVPKYNQPQTQSSRIIIRPLTPVTTFLPVPPTIQSQLPSIISSTSKVEQLHPPLLQLQHQNRQLLYRIQQYQSSIIYKNSQIQKLSIQIKDKQVQILSLRRQVQTYLKRQTIYHQNQTLIQMKNQQIQTLNLKLSQINQQNQQNFKYNNQLEQQNNQLKQQNTNLRQQINHLRQQNNEMKSLQLRMKQLERQNQQFRLIITNLQKVNKQYQIAHNIHQKLLQNLQQYPQQLINQPNQSFAQNQLINQDLYQGISQGVGQDIYKGVSQDLYKGVNQDLYKGVNQDLYKGVNQDLSKVLTTYIGDQTNPNQPSQNQYSKINSTLYNNLKNISTQLNLSNQTPKQNLVAMNLAQYIQSETQFGQPQTNSLAYKIAENLPYQQQPSYPSKTHLQSHIQHHNHSMSSQNYQGMKSSRHFNRQSSKLNIQDQAYFDFNKQNGQTQPIQSQPKNINIINQTNTLDGLGLSSNNIKQHYQKLNLIDQLTNQPTEVYQTSNILSFPQLPFTIRPEDITQHQQKINTVTFADPLSQLQNQYSYQQKPKRHNRIFTQQNTQKQNSLETLQSRIHDLAQQNKNLRQYLVKKST